MKTHHFDLTLNLVMTLPLLIVSMALSQQLLTIL